MGQARAGGVKSRRGRNLLGLTEGTLNTIPRTVQAGDGEEEVGMGVGMSAAVGWRPDLPEEKVRWIRARGWKDKVQRDSPHGSTR